MTAWVANWDGGAEAARRSCFVCCRLDLVKVLPIAVKFLRVLFLLLLLAPFALIAQDPVPVGLCQIISNPSKYDNVFVKIQAEYKATDESSYLADSACAGSIQLEGQKFVSGISLALGVNRKHLKRAADFKSDISIFYELDRVISRVGRDRQSVTLRVTAQGRIDGFPFFRMQKSGREVPFGYGHGNAFPVQIVLTRLYDIEVKPAQ